MCVCVCRPSPGTLQLCVCVCRPYAAALCVCVCVCVSTPHQVHCSSVCVYTSGVRDSLRTHSHIPPPPPTHTHRTTWWTTSMHCRPWWLWSTSVVSSTSTSLTPLVWTTPSHCKISSSIATITWILRGWVEGFCVHLFPFVYMFALMGKKTDRPTGRLTGRQTDRQTDRLAGRPAYKQTDRLTDRAGIPRDI